MNLPGIFESLDALVHSDERLEKRALAGVLAVGLEVGVEDVRDLFVSDHDFQSVETFAPSFRSVGEGFHRSTRHRVGAFLNATEWAA